MREVMEFKGTKGDWILIKKTDVSLPKGGSIVDENGITICSLFSGCKLTKPGRSIEEINANALLISKAPEMLEMLKKVALKLKGNGFPSLQEDVEQLIKEATELK